MSLAQEHAERCKRELDDKRTELNELITIRAELKQDFQKQGSLVVQADFDNINKKIEAARTAIAELGQELQQAVATLAAENKLEEELRNEMKGLGR